MLDLQDTLIILLLFLFFVCFEWFAKFLFNISFCGWVKNPYTKNAIWPVNQTKRALTSTLAGSDLFAVFSENVWPHNGCNCDSTQTSFQTSVDKFAVVNRISLWCKVTNPPFRHWRVCCKLYLLPHSQWREICFNLQSYQIDSRFQKLFLFRIYLLFWSGELCAKKTH